MGMKRRISAGEALTKNLLKRLNKNAWYESRSIGQLCINKESEHTTATAIFLNIKDNRAEVGIPENGIKGQKESFIKDFEKTMNSAYYKIKFVKQIGNSNKWE